MLLVFAVSLHYSRLRVAMLALMLLGSLTATAADNATPHAVGGTADATTVMPPTPAPAEQNKQCFNGCQRWGQMCNVDPRGVYKCQRRCEKFGEICE